MNLPNLQRILSNPDKDSQQKAIDIMDNAKREQELKQAIEEKFPMYPNGDLTGMNQMNAQRVVGVKLALNDPDLLRLCNPEIMKQAGWVREEEWIEVTDSEKFFNEFYDKNVTVICPIYNTATKQMSWEMYHAEMDNTGELYYADGAGDCGVTYKDVSYYRIEKFPPLPQPPKQ